MSIISDLAWSPSTGYPSTHPSTLKSIATTCAPALSASVSNAVASLQTATGYLDVISLSQVVRGAEASLSIIDAQEILATATDSSVQAEATEVIWESMYNLQSLADDENIYGYYLNRGGNIFFLVLFALIWLFQLGMLVKSRYHWFNITFICGYTLEFLGFLGRVLAFMDDSDINYFLLQLLSLTFAPAFIMAGIYFLFAQNVAIYGRQYSILRPMWYSYFFIGCDVGSLVIQGIGGGMASAANRRQEDPSNGIWVMFGGILFQVVAMTIFIVFWLEFISRIYFHDRKSVVSDSPLKRRTPVSYFKFLFNTSSARAYRQEHLEPFYNTKYTHIRARLLAPYFPLAVTAAVIFIYIRCVYRVVELEEGFSGYLITHEAFLMALDASMMAVAGLIFIPFHPVFVFGTKNILTVKDVKKRVPSTESEEEKFAASENLEGSDESLTQTTA
ncbi:putative transporter or flippase transmembrane protein [Metschnikowia bicuspidata var. bicuspidata NRRL YB-4993]|uniref:Sphingoid long-chain base transporter RSB1 n=1 Tax=Metschnikowia bicuspidata var. bicuspidata NRRL YB-4993 TaxID=869754 RepID=A0A1A0HIM0_9ASCO|nr:putative transporter or flippase transmembrane protein [Metschnikowia bicuspidata var. bicuspidata NRRL YB-4993]OBA23851.1 putative transporter or flippase transmembrane protein [Metschnikowia bicuspidata var. bicuspidata NRRL YB-4993]